MSETGGGEGGGSVSKTPTNGLQDRNSQHLTPPEPPTGRKLSAHTPTQSRPGPGHNGARQASVLTPSLHPSLPVSAENRETTRSNTHAGGAQVGANTGEELALHEVPRSLARGTCITDQRTSYYPRVIRKGTGLTLMTDGGNGSNGCL